MRGAHVCTRSRGGNQKVHQQEEARRREEAQSKDPGHMTLAPHSVHKIVVADIVGFASNSDGGRRCVSKCHTCPGRC